VLVNRAFRAWRRCLEALYPTCRISAAHFLLGPNPVACRFFGAVGRGSTLREDAGSAFRLGAYPAACADALTVRVRSAGDRRLDADGTVPQPVGAGHPGVGPVPGGGVEGAGGAPRGS